MNYAPYVIGGIVAVALLAAFSDAPGGNENRHPPHTRSANSVRAFGGKDLAMKRSINQSVAATI